MAATSWKARRDRCAAAAAHQRHDRPPPGVRAGRPAPLGGNSANSSRNSMPRWARVTSPGRRARPPPTSPARVMVWCGARNGRRRTRASAASSAGRAVDAGHLQGLVRGQGRLQVGRAAGPAGSCPFPAGPPAAGCGDRPRPGRRPCGPGLPVQRRQRGPRPRSRGAGPGGAGVRVRLRAGRSSASRPPPGRPPRPGCRRRTTSHAVDQARPPTPGRPGPRPCGSPPAGPPGRWPAAPRTGRRSRRTATARPGTPRRSPAGAGPRRRAAPPAASDAQGDGQVVGRALPCARPPAPD